MKRHIDRLLTALDRLFGSLACVALVAIMLVVIVQIVGRLDFLPSPIWTEELSRYLFAYAVVFAAGSLIIKNRHVRLELFQHRLSRRGGTIFSILTHLVIAAFAGLLLKHAWDYALIGRFQTSPALGIKMSWIFASAPVFFALTALFSILTAIRVWLAYLEPAEA